MSYIKGDILWFFKAQRLWQYELLSRAENTVPEVPEMPLL